MPKCRFKDCFKVKLQRWGLCNQHRKWVEKGYMTVDLVMLKAPKLKVNYKGMKCKVEDCNKKPRRNFLCENHSSAVREGRMTPDGVKIHKRFKYNKDTVCKVHNCGKKARASMFCKSHHAQYRKGILDFDGIKNRELKKVPKYTNEDFCKAEGCNKRPSCKGWCRNHRESFLRGSYNEKGKRIVAPATINKGQKCSQQECNEEALCKGLCRLHYNRMRSGYLGRVGLKNVGKQCSVPTCKRPAHCRVRCTLHYRRLLKKEKINDLRKSLQEDQVASNNCQGNDSLAPRIEISNSQEKASNYQFNS